MRPVERHVRVGDEVVAVDQLALQVRVVEHDAGVDDGHDDRGVSGDHGAATRRQDSDW